MRRMNKTNQMHQDGRSSPTMLGINRILIGIGVALGSVVLVAGASSGATTPKTSATNRPILQLTGRGDTSSPHVLLPAKWTANWRFVCLKAKRGEPFALSAVTSNRSGPAIEIINQTGLSGGGQKNYAVGGTYAFTMKTACNWTLAVTKTIPQKAVAKTIPQKPVTKTIPKKGS